MFNSVHKNTCKVVKKQKKKKKVKAKNKKFFPARNDGKKTRVTAIRSRDLASFVFLKSPIRGLHLKWDIRLNLIYWYLKSTYTTQWKSSRRSSQKKRKSTFQSRRKRTAILFMFHLRKIVITFRVSWAWKILCILKAGHIICTGRNQLFRFCLFAS